MINRVLFVMEKYCGGDPTQGPTNSESMIVGAIKSTGLVKLIRQFYFDEPCRQLGQRKMSKLLLEQCAEFKPDLVIFTPLFSPLEPSRDVIDKIANVLGIKVYIHFFDAYRPRINSWMPFANYAGVIDMLASRLGYEKNPKVIQAYPGINPQDFYDKHLKRDIDVSFVGSADPEGIRWPFRYEYINFLRNNGVNVVTSGGQRYNRISAEEYINILNRSKVSLNFCRRSDGASQLKNRVFEAMACRSFVLEDEGSETREFFDAGKDFDIFHDKEELLQKVRYYLKQDREREEIAQSGYEKVVKLYNPRNMWGYIFSKMGFRLPERLTNDKNYLVHQTKMESIIHSSYTNTREVAKADRYKRQSPRKSPKLLILTVLSNLFLYIYYLINFVPFFVIRLALIRLNMSLESLYRVLVFKLGSVPLLKKIK